MIKRALRKIIQCHRKKKLKTCGHNVSIRKKCNFQGKIHVGSNVTIGRGCSFVSTIANIYIHDNVVFGPEVVIYSGDHQTNVIGKHICEVGDKDKNDASLDRDVVIESGCWIGTRAIILKGVTIGRGSIVGAGAIVTKDVPPYSVYVGVPSAKTFQRFDGEQITEHEKILVSRGGSADSFSKVEDK